MNITTKADRDAAMKNAQSIVDRAKAAGLELTTAEAADIEDTVTAVRAFDNAAKSVKSAYGELFGTPGDSHFKDGALVSQDAPDLFETGHLSFRGLAERATSGMKSYSVSMGRTKGLVPAGETVVDIPLVNTVPLPNLTQERPPRLVDVLPAAVRSAPVYSFLKQTVIADPGAATVVAPGELKPVKKLGVERVDSRLRVIAVTSEPVDKYLLEDAASLRTWVGTELADAVEAALETQVLTGNGTGESFTGLANTSGIQTQAFQTDKLITVQYGLSKIENLGVAPSFIALSAADWLAIQTTRNASGLFDVGGPIDATARTAWGTRVVVVPGLAAGTGYIVGQDSVLVSTDGRGVRVEWGTPGDTFNRNQLVARVEGRFNLDVPKPHGIVKLTLTGA